MSSIGEIAKFRTSIQTDTINEFTSASGVTIDGVLLKDAAITASGTGNNVFSGFLGVGATPTAYTKQRIGFSNTDLAANAADLSVEGTHTLTTNTAFVWRGVESDVRISPNTGSQTTTRGSGGGLQSYIGRAYITGASATGTVTAACTFVSDIRNQSTGTLTNGLGFYSYYADNSGGGTFTNYYGFYCGAITAATTNYGYYSDLAASGTGRYNFYANGTAPNFMGGLLSVGNTATTDVALSTTVAAKLRSGSATYTDNVTAASGTVAHGTVVSFDNPAIAASNASVTYTSASTLYIDGAPTAGSNVTITNPYALYVADGAKLMNHAKTTSTSEVATTFTNTYTLDAASSVSCAGINHTTILNQATYNSTRPLTTGGGGLRGIYNIARVSGASGTVTAGSAFIAQCDNTGAGILTDGVAYYAEAAVNSGGGTFTNYYAYYAEASTAAGTNYAFYANNAASGTARYNFYAAGTAPNVFNGAITTPRTTLTASATGSGAITVINNYHAVSGAGGAASTITTINGGIDGMMVVLKAVSDTVDISFATGGNILLDGGATFTCDTLNDTITLIYDASLSKWLEIGRCNNS